MKIQLAISLANTILAILKNKLKQFFILFVTSAKHIKLNFISYLPIIYISTFILYWYDIKQKKYKGYSHKESCS